MSAATYYVNQNHPAASNTNPGTESEPLATIAGGIGRLAGGDTLFVKGGTYTEYPYISGLIGSDAYPTVIRVYPGDHVTVQGSADPAQGITSGRLKITGCRYLRLEGFEVRYMNQGIFIENGSEYVTVRNCTVHHVGQEAVHIRENSDHVTIEDCAIYDTRKWQYNGEGIYIGTGSAGPPDRTGFTTIRNNRLYNIVDEAIEFKPGTHDGIAEGNTIYDSGTALASTTGLIEANQQSAGVQNWPANPNHLIRNNVIHDVVAGSAIRAGTGCLVYNNVIYDMPGYGIYVNNPSSDGYTRRIYFNTVDLPPGNSIVVQGGSAAVNAAEDLGGVVSYDLDGNPRTIGSAPDMGAYESNHTGEPSAPQRLRVVTDE